jgi:hypothetical protein
MPTEPSSEAGATQPVLNERMPDGGVRYVETPADPAAPDAPAVAEPWNTVTAALFVVIALVWLWRLRGRYRAYPFVACCLPILLTGGIGGTLYHGTRLPVHIWGYTLKLFFVLDVGPIQILGLLGGLYMGFRYFEHLALAKRLLLLMGLIVFYTALNVLFFAALGDINRQLSINLSYASLALLVLVPIGAVLWRTRFRHGAWVVVGLISFGIAWVARLVDQYSAPYLPMGSHWLWHTFGAISTAAMIQFFYKVEGEPLPGPALRTAPEP